MISVVDGRNLKKDTNEFIYKAETDSQTVKTNLYLPKGTGVWGGAMDWGSGISICTLLYIEWIVNRDLMYSTGNSAQYSAVTYMGKEYEKEWICVLV